VKACNSNLTCITKADGTAATYFSTFASQLQATPMPSGAAAAASKLQDDATQAAQDFTRLSKAATVSGYRSTFASTGLQQTLDQPPRAFNALGTPRETPEHRPAKPAAPADGRAGPVVGFTACSP